MLDTIDTVEKIAEFIKIHGKCFIPHRSISVYNGCTAIQTLRKFNLLSQNGVFGYDVLYSFTYYNHSDGYERLADNGKEDRSGQFDSLDEILKVWKSLDDDNYHKSDIHTSLFPYLKYQDQKIRIFDFGYYEWDLKE